MDPDHTPDNEARIVFNYDAFKKIDTKKKYEMCIQDKLGFYYTLRETLLKDLPCHPLEFLWSSLTFIMKLAATVALPCKAVLGNRQPIGPAKVGDLQSKRRRLSRFLASALRTDDVIAAIEHLRDLHFTNKEESRRLQEYNRKTAESKREMILQSKPGDKIVELARRMRNVGDRNIAVVPPEGKSTADSIAEVFQKVYDSAKETHLLIPKAKTRNSKYTGMPGTGIFPDAENLMSHASRCLKKMPPKKAPGVDDVTGNLLKYGGFELTKALVSLSLDCIQNENVPDQWKEGRVIPVYKGKGDKTNPSNYRPITLLSMGEKILQSTHRPYHI
jgi:hypothetical protein